jgi:hypothetical protein
MRSALSWYLRHGAIRYEWRMCEQKLEQCRRPLTYGAQEWDQCINSTRPGEGCDALGNKLQGRGMLENSLLNVY